MENTKVLYQVRQSRSLTYKQASKILQQYQARIDAGTSSYSSSFNVPSDIADKLTIVAEELQKLAGLVPQELAEEGSQSPLPVTTATKKQDKKEKKKRPAEEVIAEDDEETSNNNNNSNSKKASKHNHKDKEDQKPLKKKHKSEK